MTKPTAEEELDWLKEVDCNIYSCSGLYEVVKWSICSSRLLGRGPTPLEAIRNAMKENNNV